MKRILLALALWAAPFSPSVMAADMPVKAPARGVVPAPVYGWTGFYLGANVGGHWGSDDITTTADPIGWTAPNAAEIDRLAATSLHPRGVIGGVQGGFNWQVSNFVLGLEADANWLGGSASRSRLFSDAVLINSGDVMTNATKATFLATVRPRVGITFDQLLIYATGGVAFGRIEITDTFCYFGCVPPPDLSSVSISTTRTGWTAGAGFEYGVFGNWSVKAEYLHVDLGSFSATVPPCPLCGGAALGIAVHHKYTDEIARIGVNYRFGRP